MNGNSGDGPMEGIDYQWFSLHSHQTVFNRVPIGVVDSAASLSSTKEENKTIFERFGYIVGTQIGSGSYANVKLAYSLQLQCNIALKIIRKKRASKLFLHRFLPREIDLVKDLHHPNIIHHYQCIHTSHRVIIAMEYAENGTILQLLRAKHLSEDDARNFFRQLLGAVKYIHAKDIAHRDLKLENLLLDSNNVLKLIDFGFATHNISIETAPWTKASLSSTFCGSAAYASPEILKHIPYDPKRSDVWASGVILYAMVYGRLPFNDTSLPLLLKSVKHGPQFPENIAVSDACKSFLKLLIAPLNIRIRTERIEPCRIEWLQEKKKIQHHQ